MTNSYCTMHIIYAFFYTALCYLWSDIFNILLRFIYYRRDEHIGKENAVHLIICLGV